MSPVALAPGALLGDFELLRPLGEGGMGVVWLARERPLAREVALKLMRPADSATREERFAREARALAALDHPSILPILRTGSDPATGLRYIATPAILLSPDDIRHLCDDVLRCPYPSTFAAPATTPLPLAALLDGGKALPEAAVLRLARDLVGALAAAHAAGILHRDLKPSNILYDASGRALLADFGLAKFTRREEVSAQATLSLDETGHRKFLGSPAYAAPEIFREDGVATPALDWYSFGAVLYEALTGDRPRSLRAPSSYDRAHISRAWDPFVTALLEPDPAKRLCDPDAICRALDRIARRPANGRCHRWLWLGASLGFLGILGTLGILGHLGFLDGRNPETSGQPPALQNLEPAALQPPRLASIWQGDDRGPLQLLNTYRQSAVDDVITEAIATIDPETRRLLREGDAAWTASPRDVAAANKAYHTAAVRLRDAMAAERGGASPPGEPPEAGGGGASPPGEPSGGSGGIPPSVRVCRALALARLSWTYVVSASHGAADVPYGEALELLDPLVESDPDRYAPLRSWLLAERAYMECMEDRFGEALGDLREAGILWTGHVPVDGAYEAQVVILQASMGGMCRKVGDRSAALEMTTRAIVALEELAAGAEGDSVGGRARPAGAPPGGAGLGLPPSFVNLLAGCHYRRAELLHDLGSRLESLQSYRRALDVWRGQFRRAGEPYRLTYAQVLGRVANACIDLEEYGEAIAAWEEMRETLRPLVESDPEQYGPVDAGIRDNIATAHRDLGDESRATAEAEAKDSANSP